MQQKDPEFRNESDRTSDTQRRPHRSGQEYEYGETPETGLGGGGVGQDPGKAYARRSEQSLSEVARRQKPVTPTRQNGGGAEASGLARGRAAEEPGRGGRRSAYDDDNIPPNVKGQHGLPPEIEDR